jgi:cell wall-associated NlpC family hydrolase
VTLEPGDIIFCHRKGIVPWIIRTGQKLRNPKGSYWSHVAIVAREDYVIEALTRGVKRTHISEYSGIEFSVKKTSLQGMDTIQALNFAGQCVGQKYGWFTILGIALRFLTPGRGLWFGMNGSEICSGLVAQALVRGWYIFDYEPASMTPAELWEVL